MSRVGKQPIQVPSGTKVELKNGVFYADGPKGKVSQKILDGVSVNVEKDVVTVSRSGESGPERSLHGLMRALLANAVQGVSEGFAKVLEIVGVGYRAELKGSDLHLALGYSHPVVYRIPESIKIEVEKTNRISISGPDRQLVGQVAAEIRSLRPPDVYKGKGIRYAGETLIRKVGKAGAK